jgi:hypothetical protein
MKAVLVIDMPTDCIKCPLANGYCWNTFPTKERADGCPLKPLPRKLDANDWHRLFGGKYEIREAKGYGWNAYRKELLGEEE